MDLKDISVKGKNQARFIRLSSLEEGYTETDLRAHFLGQQEHKPRENATTAQMPAPSVLSLISRASCRTKAPDISAGHRFIT